MVDRYFPPGDNSQSWHVFDPTLAAQYHFSDDAMAYLSWGKGFKAGGWTTRLSANDTAEAAQFSPEYTKTWELGLKSEWFDHHLKANAAVYYTDYPAFSSTSSRASRRCTPTPATPRSRVPNWSCSRSSVAGCR